VDFRPNAGSRVSVGLTVEVVDPDPGSGASGVAAGMLAPVTEARLGEEDALQLGLASLSMWPGFAAEVDAAVAGEGDGPGPSGPSGPTGRVPTDDHHRGAAGVGFRADGCVMVAADADDRVALHDLVDRQRALGLDVEDLSARALRDLEPALAPGVRRGAFAGAECSVDPAALVRVLLAIATRAGVAVRRASVRRVVRSGGDTDRVTGIELDDGEVVHAGAVVVAAGAWSGQLGGLPGGAGLPVRPVKGQVLTLRQRDDDVVVRHTVRGVVRGSSIYLVPRDDGRLVCGATVEERGWDRPATAGGGYELLRDVLTLFPGLDQAELVGVRAGFRPGTPDDLPLVGNGGVDGLVVATGHYRNGILLTPITAAAVAALVAGEPVPEVVRPCDPARFVPARTPDSVGDAVLDGITVVHHPETETGTGTPVVAQQPRVSPVRERGGSALPSPEEAAE
jgi:glycine oxidase